MPRTRSRKATSLCQFFLYFQSLLCWYHHPLTSKNACRMYIKVLFCPWHELFDDVFDAASMDKKDGFRFVSTFDMPWPSQFHVDLLFCVSWQGDKVTVSCAEGDTGYIYKGELKFENLGRPKTPRPIEDKHQVFVHLQWGLIDYFWIRFAIPTPLSPPESDLHFIYFDRKTPKNCWSERHTIYFIHPLIEVFGRCCKNLLERNMNIRKTYSVINYVWFLSISLSSYKKTWSTCPFTDFDSPMIFGS